MRQVLILLAGAAALMSCARKPPGYAATDSTAAREIQLPRTDSTVALNDRPIPPEPAPAPRRVPPRPKPAPPPAPAPLPATAPAPPPAPAPRASARLAAGTTLEASATREITSRHNKAGELFMARIGEDLTAPDGRVVIPAGSEVTLSIVALKPAPNKSAKDGTLELRAVSVMVNGVSYPIDADVTYIEHTLKGRGVTGSEAAKVGVGAAAGAIIGKVIGGGTGAAVGAATGAAGGAVVAVETADRDVVVPVGARIKLVLRSAFGVED
ncbi:MAG TPA: hypothetical protein VGP61_03420 [Gemmatimonadales bacterium]|nr:hypothetical protein [Gemmatimonadales bacterium]